MKIFKKEKKSHIDPGIYPDIDRYLAEREPHMIHANAIECTGAIFADDYLQVYEPKPQAAPQGSSSHEALSVASQDADLQEAAPQAASAPDHTSQTGYRKAAAPAMAGESIERMLANADDTFQQHLLKLIDSKSLRDSYVYKKAAIDRRLFSKIRSNVNYSPKKETALSLCLALELNVDETTDLLRRAGYALSASSRFDLIIRYCIEHRIYDISDVNDILYHYDQPLLGQ